MRNTILIFGLIFFNNAFGCSCGGPDITRMEGGAEIVAVGELKTKRYFYSFSKNQYTFNNLKIFKGSNIDEIKVWTPKLEMSCGLKAENDMPYVLFVYRENGKLVVDHCSSWPLTKRYFDYTKEFNMFYKLLEGEALIPIKTP